MFIDSHCHLDAYEEHSGESLDQLFDRLQKASAAATKTAGAEAESAKTEGAMPPLPEGDAMWSSPKKADDSLIRMPEAFVHVACSPKSFDRAIELSEKYPFVYAAYGLHPECVLTETAEDEARMMELLKHPKAIACGEFGLDYHYGSDTKEAQVKLFERHLQMGIESGKPLVLHLREADDDAIAILKNANLHDTKIHVHCFTGDDVFVKRLLELDAQIFVGFTGIVTFKTAQNVRDAAAVVPLEQMLLETDSPYMAPVPHRGKTCHPGFIPYTARMLAHIKNVPVEDLYRHCRENTRTCYGI